MAISLVSNPSFSKVLIKICYAASSCGAMIADTKALTLAGLGKEEGRIRGVTRREDSWGKPPILPLLLRLRLAAVPEVQTGRGAQPQVSGSRPR
jgi:hypothetical protein